MVCGLVSECGGCVCVPRYGDVLVDVHVWLHMRHLDSHLCDRMIARGIHGCRTSKLGLYYFNRLL
jgi:hypothetical protein